MKQYFKIGPARCKTLGIPDGTVFPVIRVENNMVGGKGFDTYVYLDTGDGYCNGVYIGQQEMFAARGEFVTEAEYLASLRKPGATVAFSLLPVGAKFSWMGSDRIVVKTSPFSAESYNGMYSWSAIDKHFKVNDLVTFWE